MHLFNKFCLLNYLMLTCLGLLGQQAIPYDYEVSSKHPFGSAPSRMLPSRSKILLHLLEKAIVGQRPGIDQQRWKEPIAMLWRFKYIMNGKGIQDETLKADGIHSGSIRQYNADSALWYVHYYSSNAAVPILSSWEGGKTEDGNILLYRPQKAPNGMEGFYRLTFYDIANTGFKWIGEWVNPEETIVYPTWKIDCKKRE